jgi:hypothetical protein
MFGIFKTRLLLQIQTLGLEPIGEIESSLSFEMEIFSSKSQREEEGSAKGKELKTKKAKAEKRTGMKTKNGRSGRRRSRR